MVGIARAALVALFVGVLSVVARAEAGLSVPQGLVQGQTVTVSYSDPSKPNQTVTVEIDNGGFPVATVVTVEIQLDAQGNGSKRWTVPEWDAARFNAPGCEQESRSIDDPPVPIALSVRRSPAPSSRRLPVIARSL
jgi:hypothetical protein